MLKLKLQCWDRLMGRTHSLKKTLMLGKIGGRRRRKTEDEKAGWHHWINGHEFEQLQKTVKDREVWRAEVHRVAKSQTGLNKWTIPHPLCQDVLVNGFLEQEVWIEPCSIHSTHWPGIVVLSGIVHPSQGKEKVWTTGLLHLFQCLPRFVSGYWSYVKVSVLFYQRVVFCFLVGEVYLWVLFLVRVISMH